MMDCSLLKRAVLSPGGYGRGDEPGFSPEDQGCKRDDAKSQDRNSLDKPVPGPLGLEVGLTGFVDGWELRAYMAHYKQLLR